MKYLKQISSVLLSIMFFFANSSSGSAQDWPDPLVELVSISSDASSYFIDGKIKFDLTINRINDSNYSDITRVWICPKANWDGFMCNTGQFLVSTTPSSTISQFTIESPVLTLLDDEYFITGVSFRNGAIIAGFTLMYPRVGVVTIGGIATTMGLVNLAAADFKITTPAPEPEPESSGPDSTNSEASTESGSTLDPEPDSAPITEPITTPTTTDNTQTTDMTDPQQSTELDETAEPTSTTESTNEPEAEPTSEHPTEEVESNSSTDQSDNTDSAGNVDVIESEPIRPATMPVDTGPATTQLVTQAIDNQPIVTPTVVTQSAVEIKILTPNVAAVITSEVETKPESIVTISDVAPAISPAIKQKVVMRGAIGGKVLQITGEAKLIRSVSAGVGRLKLIGSNDSVLLVKLGSKVVTQMKLSQDQVISWRSNRPGKLKLILSGDSAVLNIDALQLNGKLIANPSFQMRS